MAINNYANDDIKTIDCVIDLLVNNIKRTRWVEAVLRNHFLDKIQNEINIDSSKTSIITNFTFDSTVYTNATDPSLDGKPVMVIAVKSVDFDNNESIEYTFVDLSDVASIGGTTPVNVSNVTVPNEKSGVIEINGAPKAVVRFATDSEFDEMLQDAGLAV